MNSTATDYYSASLNRLDDFIHLRKNTASAVFALYCAGVGIECMFRAYMLRETTEFDAKHNLEKLYVQSKMATKLSDTEREKISAVIKQVNNFWDNNFRYASTVRMKRYLAHELAGRKTPADLNKYLDNYYSHIFDAAEFIIKIGTEKWN